MVKKTSLTSGLSFFSRSSASMPLRWGMVISATMTSGLSFFAAAGNARPSSTAPTSSNSSASKLLSPSTTMRWSSASSTRGRVMAFLLEWNPGEDDRSLAGRALDIQFAVQQIDALLHACQAKTWTHALSRRIKANAIVAYAQFITVLQSPQRDFRGFGLGMASYISECLLHDSKQAKRNVSRWRFRAVL